MRKFVAAGIIILTTFNAYSGNIKIENNESNCRKVDGFGNDDKINIATKYKTSLASVKFIGTSWEAGQFGTDKTCVFLFDTAVGPKRCAPLALLSDDNGKTAFGSISIAGSAMCW